MNPLPSADVNSRQPGTVSSSSEFPTLPIFDAFLDLPHPAASQNVNGKRMIVAPPPGEAFARSKDVGVELATEAGLARVASFCFPEFHPDLKREETNISAESVSPISPMLNKYDIYMQDYCSSNRVLGGPYHVFAMQLSSGQRVYGHVRRYLPHHPVAKGRYDVGRRGIRAMVLLTRINGAENLYHALLKTIESLSSHRSALDHDLQFQSSPQQLFLHKVHEEHSRLSKLFQLSNDKVQTFHALTVSIPQIEMGSSIFLHVDYSNFLLPLTLMSPLGSSQSSVSPILPILRCLGISHTLRLFSALMCERRVVLVSQSTSRLSACAAAAMSILEQGLLHWQHIYIPILPPSMLNYLAAPMPYLVGLTGNHAHNIEKIPGLGEVLVVYLDQNDIVTHNMSRPDLAIPDILSYAEFDEYQYQQQQQQRFVSIAEVLKSDLINVMRMDRKTMMGENGGAAGAVKEKGRDLLKRGLGKLKKVAKKKIDKSRSLNGSIHNTVPNQGMDPPGITDDDEEDNELSFSYVFSEGFNNQVVEEDVKIAFTTFFLSFVGDMRWYLRPQSTGPPVFDKDLFLEARERLGDSKNSPIYGLTAHFKETQIFEMFVKARVEDVQAKKPIMPNATLFTKASHYLMSNRMSFSSPEIRNILRQISSSNPNTSFIQEAVNIKRRAMALTSNSRPEHLVASELSKLVQDCRECVSVLGEVMSVIWERIRDCRGMQWKHGYYALQMLLELILHGPLAAVTEATDGIDSIRRLKSYENMRNLVAQDMRSMATSVYSLLVNRARLFAMRRVCALRRMEAVNASRNAKKPNKNLRIRMKFNVMHALLKPGGAVSPAPVTDLLGTSIQPPIAVGTNGINTPQSHLQLPTFGDDLLSLSFPASSTSELATSQAPNNPLDITDMMNNVSIVQQASPFTPSPTTATSSFVAQPTIANIPVVKQEQATMTVVPPNSQASSAPSTDNNFFHHNQHQQPSIHQPHHFSSGAPIHQQVYYNQNNSLQHQVPATGKNMRSQFDPLA